ncbi:hypothetical protein L6468_05810 [Prevotella communis]|uniref:hypothetical protein n=1 Tax=Prevotella communis TaxID=2913614 RepID=UPI001EDC6F15|nr:hypothetical protein [Prevotella communis]UKK63274.1 hypothetical protein L6468_05810 [Prevotella communis]UKK66099.1 hypothetical protein L6473_05810 [Prevotella communis]
MIVRLEKEQQKSARRKLLADPVYIISHDALRKMKQDGHTQLSPVELFLSAQELCETLLALPDVMEGLDDEIDDLEDEAEGENDAMLIMTLATAQLQARSKKCVGIDIRKIIFHIYERLDGHDLLWPLIEQMTNKEDARWLEGKKSNLLNYELQEIKLNGGGSEEVKQLFADMVECSDKMDKETIKGNLLFLNRYNIDHNHAYDKEVIALFDKFGIKSTTIIKPKEYVSTKIVDTEIQNVEAGGTGVIKEMKKD